MSKDSVFPSDYGSAMSVDVDDATEGDGASKIALYQVCDKRLAACLIAVGIPLRKDPSHLQRKTKKDGVRTIFHFYPADEQGQLKTGELIKAWSQDLDFIKANPLHPFTFAMCALRNYQNILERLKSEVPFVGFRTRRNGRAAVYWVKEGKRKHKAALKKGLKQI